MLRFDWAVLYGDGREDLFQPGKDCIAIYPLDAVFDAVSGGA